MLRILKVELMKLQWWLVGGLVIVGPALAVLLGSAPGATVPDADRWSIAYSMATIRYAWLFYPLLAGVFAALICRAEHVGGGWKQMLALPVPRSRLYLAKLAVLAAILAATNLTFGALVVVRGAFDHLGSTIPWQMIGMSLLSGWVAVLPLAAVQLWVSTRWRSFGAALALNVCFTLPAIFAAQSAEFGPWYPWAQPMLAMTPIVTQTVNDATLNVSPATLWIVIIGGLAVALAGGLLTFVRADFAG
ncbi:MAG: ABC transporter permease [Coriobacteriia bacterium]